MRSPVRIWSAAPEKQSPRWGGCFSAFCGIIRTGDLTREARYNKRTAQPPASSNLVSSSRKAVTPVGWLLFCVLPISDAGWAAAGGFQRRRIKRAKPLPWTRLVPEGDSNLVASEITPHGSEKAATWPHAFSSSVLRASSFQNQNRTGAPSLVDNFGSPLCWVLILYRNTGLSHEKQTRSSHPCGVAAFLHFAELFELVTSRAKHYCAIYDADIAKNYDRVSPLAQIQKPRETIKI